VVGVKLLGEPFATALPDTVVPPGAILVVAGRTDQVERFAALP
jgi:trk system potassium uptake protein